MEGFVIRKNIEHYRQALGQTCDEDHRQRIAQLLKEEEDKLAKFIGSENGHDR